jgi:hypothetical protein
MRKFVLRPSPELVVAFVALLVAIGGTSFAAFRLPKNSVGTKQLMTNAVTSKKIKNGAVTSSKIATGAVTAAKINTSGLTVPNAAHAASADSATTAGDASTLAGQPPSAFARSVAWALVRADGTIDSESGGISVSARSGRGDYFLDFGRNVSGDPILVSLNYGNYPGSYYQGGQVTAAPCGALTTFDPVRTNCNPTGTNDSNHVFVLTTDQTGAAAARPFYIVIPR